jgi:hypothetical protein
MTLFCAAKIKKIFDIQKGAFQPFEMHPFVYLVMQNKQDITINKMSSLRDLVRSGDC